MSHSIHRYGEADRAAVYRVIRERRDVRRFVPAPIEPETLERILESGVGWVSMFEPQALATLLRFPSDARPIAILCLGHVEAFDPAPRLAIERWRQPRPLTDMLYEDRWPEGAE